MKFIRSVCVCSRGNAYIIRYVSGHDKRSEYVSSSNARRHRMYAMSQRRHARHYRYTTLQYIFSSYSLLRVSCTFCSRRFDLSILIMSNHENRAGVGCLTYNDCPNSSEKCYIIKETGKDTDGMIPVSTH